jgi:hypothetical protein
MPLTPADLQVAKIEIRAVILNILTDLSIPSNVAVA